MSVDKAFFAMPLEPGTWLGSCEILAPLGAGGMGEVYKARDTVMKREVALKVLPADLSRDPERSARLEREAHMIGQMSHPNVGVIYDLRRQGDLIYLVLELIPGETLGRRLEEGALPVRDALIIFKQVASALEATHAKGIIHRDLKPENVKITPDAVVKVLDFGLAREVAESIGNSGKTRTGPLTEAGTIVGTVAYMSPEQSRGQPLDKRTDIWSFGCCLYEALSGARPFRGDSAADVRANVLKEEPDFGLLPSKVSAEIRKLIQRCLKKDLNQRLRDIGDARLEIESALEGPEERSVGHPGGLTPSWAALSIGLALLAGALLAALFRDAPREENLRRFAVELPPTEPMVLDAGPALAVSADGTQFVYTVQRGDSTELRRRLMDQLEPVRIAGTEGAQGPFFRSGSTDLAFFSKGQLLRLSPNDSPPDRLGESPSARGGSWMGDTIVFSPQTESGLSSTSSRGASVDSVTKLGPGEKSHRWPSLLPGGRRALVTCWTEKGFEVRVADLESGETKLVIENASYARLAPTGHVLFVRDFTLMAARFEQAEERIVGEPTPMVENVHVDRRTGAAFYDVASEGTLVYAPRAEEEVEGEAYGRLLSIDPDGGKAELLHPVPRGYQVPRLSPSGRSLLTTLTEGGSTDIWLMSLSRGTLSRVTMDGQSGTAIWADPDETRIAFAAQRDGAFHVLMKGLDSRAPEKRVATGDMLFPTSWDPDGYRLALVQFDPSNQFDVWIWTESTGRSEPFLSSPANESAGVFAPDGRYLAYVSDETGEDEVYVVSLDGSSPKTQISTSGGVEPVFRRDGSALYYRDEEWIMEVPIQTGTDFTAGEPVRLFPAPFDEGGSPFANYDVSKDGKRFVMVRTDEGRDAKRLIVVTHWDSLLREQVPLSR